MQLSKPRRAASSSGHSSRRQRKPRRLLLERLEPRSLLAVAPPGVDAAAMLSGHGGVCTCPVCTGQGLDQIPTAEESPAGPAASNPLSSLPQLSSRPSASAKLYLDFNGHFQASWGSYSNASTPVFDQDGDPTTFSTGELGTISNVWARVSEDYAPFDIDVTTIAPGSLANGVVAHIAIGGNYSDWFGDPAGGVAYIGGFYNSAPNVGYVFEAALGNGNSRFVAEAASHEAGHLFGLEHQSLWSGTTLVDPYNPGNDDWAPIMGVGYYSDRTTWHNGPTPYSRTDYQSDLAVLAGASNGFGLVADDVGSTIATAAALSVTGNTVDDAGLLHTITDLDVFEFETGGGAINVQLNVAPFGPNLDAIFQLWNASGTVLVSANPAAWLGATISTNVGAGTYYLVARSAGGYGNLGRYTLSGTIPAVVPAEIAVEIGGLDTPSGSTVDFGTTTPGAPVSQVFTIHNTGPGNLTLTQLTADDLPEGFELVTNLGSTLLASGESTTFEVRLAAVDGGQFGGVLEIASNDDDENPFVLTLAGEVDGQEITVTVDGDQVYSGDTFSFGSTAIGTEVQRTFTIENTGTQTLTLTAIDPLEVPAGFTLVSNLGSTVLLAGESTTFVLRLDAAAAGTYAGQFLLHSDDGDESPFTIDVAGSAAAPVQIIDNGAAGNTRVGAWTTVTNRGYQGDIHVATRGTGSKQANWTFNNLPAGEYRVWATWTGGSVNATNAPYRIFYGGATAPTIRVNQRTAPTGLTADGGRWRFLGAVNAAQGWLQVKLTNQADGTVVADAIRLVHVPSGAAFTLSHSDLLASSGAGAPPGAIAAALSSDSIEVIPLQPATAARPQSAIQFTRQHAPEQPYVLPPAVSEQTLDLVSRSRASADEPALLDLALQSLLASGL